MKIAQYKHRHIRKYVIDCFNRRCPDICQSPPGTYLAWWEGFASGLKTIALYDTMSSSKIITIAHNLTKNGDVWVAPIDATQPNTLLSPYVKYIKNQLELMPNK